MENPIQRSITKMENREEKVDRAHIHPQHMRHHLDETAKYHSGGNSNPLRFPHVGIAQAFGITR